MQSKTSAVFAPAGVFRMENATAMEMLSTSAASAAAGVFRMENATAMEMLPTSAASAAAVVFRMENATAMEMLSTSAASAVATAALVSAQLRVRRHHQVQWTAAGPIGVHTVSALRNV